MSTQDQSPAAEAAGEEDYDTAWDAINQQAAPEAPPEEDGPVVEGPGDPEEHSEAEETPPAEDDPWTAAPEALRTAHHQTVDELEKLRQRVRSDDGRVAAYQRRIRELEEAPKVPAKEEPPNDDDLKPLLDEYPDIGKPIAERLIRQDAEITALREQFSKVDTRFQGKEEAHWKAQEAVLGQAHADWQDVLSAENAPTFHAWLNLQDESIKAAAHANSDYIEDAAGAIKVVGGFKEFLNSIRNPQPQPAAQPNNRRERQLAGATTVRTTGGQAFAPGIPEEGAYDDIWDAIDRQDRAKAR